MSGKPGQGAHLPPRLFCVRTMAATVQAWTALRLAFGSDQP